jgi:beta-galactosidase
VLFRSAGSAAPASAAFIFDWENRWALEAARTAYSSGSGYVAACLRHHRALWSLGVRTDVIDMEQDFSGYRLLAAPMLFMLKPGVAERLDKFVLAGVTLVATYCCSLVDESGLCFPGGAPGPLRRLLGIRVEETDGMYPQERNRLVMGKRNPLGIAGSFEARNYCDLVHTESARPLGSYGGGFYKGSAALTVNDLGRGHAFYLACDASDLFLSAFYSSLCRESRLPRATGSDLPEGVCAQVRTNDRSEFLFLLNFTARVQRVSLGSRDFRDAQTGEKKQRKVSLQPYGFLVLERGAS